MRKTTNNKNKTALAAEGAFDEIVRMIDAARERAWRAVNTELVSLYWEIGKWLSARRAKAEWGDKVVANAAEYLASRRPDLKGYNKRTLYRMLEFYETYKDDQIVTPLVTQIGWTQHLIIMTWAKTPEERLFYIEKCISAPCSKRSLERLFDSSFYERRRLGEGSPSSALVKPRLRAEVPDLYALEFLDLPRKHREATLRDALVSHMRDFILELGGDFTFVGQEYPIKVGKSDFTIDLLFYNRALRCFFAFELKTRRFRPADIGQIDFYLEALDRDVRKPDENPSAGGPQVAKLPNELLAPCIFCTGSPPVSWEVQLPTRFPANGRLAG